MRLINQHSFVVIALALLAATFVVRRLPGPGWAWNAGLAVLAVGFYLAMRTGAGAAEADLQRALASGRPVAVEFYSDL